MYLLIIYSHDVLTHCGKALEVLHFFRQSINYIKTLIPLNKESFLIMFNHDFV